jgi:hypothetical protein
VGCPNHITAEPALLSQNGGADAIAAIKQIEIKKFLPETFLEKFSRSAQLFSWMLKHTSVVDMTKLAMGQLPTPKSIRVQRHISQCEPCLRQLVERTIGLALLGLGPEILVPVNHRRPLFIVHDTADGFVYARTEHRGRQWIARHWGDQLDGGRECKTMREANEYLTVSFAQMFPEHRCTDRCQLDPPIASSWGFIAKFGLSRRRGESGVRQGIKQ